jgi:hypothetical protein
VSIYRIPIDRVTIREVSLRVAYRLVVASICRNPLAPGETAAHRLLWLSAETTLLRLSALTAALDQFAMAVARGERLTHYLASAIADVRRGALEERRRLLPSYKGQRVQTPRVTNRGGQTSGSVWEREHNDGSLPDDLGGDDGHNV